MFRLFTTDDGHAPPLEYLPCGAITPTMGMALVQSSGVFAIATGANKPTYISAVQKSAACTSGDIIPVIRVTPDMIFECTNSAAFTSVVKGDKVTLHATSGLQVTATEESGVAEIIDFDAAAVTETGKRVLVRFP